MRSLRYSVLLVLFGVLSACTPQSMPITNSGGAVLETEDQKILNALGQDALVELDDYSPQIQAFIQGRLAGAAEDELAQATAFMEEQAAVEGANLTESGIVIQAITPGTRNSPTSDDTVKVYYHRTLRDGTVFDSSVDRAESATFPLNGVIPCWTEGLQHIGVGGESRLVCTQNLAYGPQGPPGIPGKSALVFEVELLEIIQN